MFRKIMALLGIAMGLVLLTGLLTPAQAWQTDVNCNSHERSLGRSTGYVCAEVQWHRQADGTGYVIDNVQLSATPASAFESSGLRVDGYGASIYNDNTTSVWGVGDASSNIGQSGLHFYGMGDTPYKVNSLSSLHYEYGARMENSADRYATVVVRLG